jgi:hypothetical protein
MLPRAIDAVMGIVAPGIVAHPLIVSVYVWRFRVPGLIAEVPVLLAVVLVSARRGAVVSAASVLIAAVFIVHLRAGLCVTARIRRRAVFRDVLCGVLVAAPVTAVLSAAVVIALSER